MDEATQCNLKGMIPIIETRSRAVQAGVGLCQLKDFGTQTDRCGLTPNGSYNRRDASQSSHWTYEDLLEHVLCSKVTAIEWLMEKKIIKSSRKCPQCESEMKLQDTCT